MNTRELFKRAVIEAIHGESYETAVKKEQYYKDTPKFSIQENSMLGKYKPWDISLARVMQALASKGIQLSETVLTTIGFDFSIGKEWMQWKLTDDNGRELNDDQQDIKDIEAIYNLLK